MAELSLGTSTQGESAVQDEDGEFKPSADMLVHDFDDEQTLEEEERLQGETNFSSEIDDLTREGEMPIHELLKMYGYGGGDSEEEDEGTEEQDVLEKDQRNTAQAKVKEHSESCDQEEDAHSSSDESAHCKRVHGTAQLLCAEPSSYFDGNDADESEDEDYVPSEEWKKEVKVGPMYQAETPAGLCKYEDNEKAYENDDQLLWNPELLPEKEVVEYLAEASKRTGEETAVEVVPEKPLVKDNEQALFELVNCNFDREEALSKLKFNTKPAKDELPFWLENEKKEFEKEDESCENDSIEANKQIKLWRRNLSSQSDIMTSTGRLASETDSTEVNQAVAHPATSSYSGGQMEREILTTHKDADCQSAKSHTHWSLHRFQQITADHQLHSSSNPINSPSKVRQREDEFSESPLKRQKTEVDLLITAAAVSGSRMETV